MNKIPQISKDVRPDAGGDSAMTESAGWTLRSTGIRRGDLLNRSSRQAFSLIEVMVVVTFIGILAMLGMPAIQKSNLRARGTAFMNDGRVFAEAFQRYAAEKGDFPATQGSAGVYPAEMTGFLNPDKWLKETPFSGNYLWDDQKSEGSATIQGAIVIVGGTFSLDELRLVDDWIDDGSLSSGQIQVKAAGAAIYYVLGE